MLEFRMIRHLLLCCVLTLACAGVLPSCDSDDVIATGEEQASEAESPKIVFTIFMMDNDSSSGISRSSTWGDTYDEEDEESDYEMYISSLNVLLYDSDNSYVTSVRQVSLGELSDSTYIYARNKGSDVVYTYIGTIDDMSKISNPSSFTGKIMVLANCDASETSMDGLKSTTYGVSGTTTDGIPMWGVTSLSDISFKGGNINLGEIDLLRAMAKVKIKLDDDVADQGYTITKAIISPYNTQGYCLPADFSTVSETGEIDRDAINVSDSWASTDNFVFGTSENDGNAVVAYLAEYDNTSSDVTPATINVTISSDNSGEIGATLYFGEYNEGVYDESSAYDIVRNHQYTYTLSFYPDSSEEDSNGTAEDTDTEGTSDETETENKVIDPLSKSDKVKIKGVSLRVEEI